MKADDFARIELLKDLCAQAKRLRDDAEALCHELTLQIERAHKTRGAPSRQPDRRRVVRPTVIERRRRR